MILSNLFTRLNLVCAEGYICPGIHALSTQWGTNSLLYSNKLQEKLNQFKKKNDEMLVWDNFFVKSPIGRGCGIRQLHLSRVIRPFRNECPAYDTKRSDGEDLGNAVLGFGECRIRLYYHNSQAHSAP